MQIKKALAIIICTVGFAINVNAQSGSCKISGTNDYVQITFNSAPTTNKNESIAHFVVANSSVRPLVSAHVVITAQITTTFGQGDHWQDTVLYDDYIYNIDALKSASINFTLCKYVKIKDIRITVNNPSCG